jgi:predicted DNA-binding protein
METTTIRVPVETRDRLNELARRRGEPAGDVVAALVQEADDMDLLTAAAEAWGRIGRSRKQLAAYRGESEELAEFDGDLPPY